jgi:hypothetical protein
VLAGACPNLLAEAGLYRYDPDAPGRETPRKVYDHTLDALRYLVSKIDYRRMARLRRGPLPEDLADGTPPPPPTHRVPAAAGEGPGFRSRRDSRTSRQGGKDRRTVLPQSAKEALRKHLERVRQLHEKDLARGLGEAALPNALDRKLPAARPAAR